MNQANVDALAALLSGTGVVPRHDSWSLYVAKYLAAQGVLVPSALGYREVSTLPEAYDYYGGDMGATYRREEFTAGVVHALERIARGET